MDAVEDGDGTTLLDNSMFLLGSGLSDAALHICTDLPVVIAGGAGGAITPDRHLKSPAGTPIANLWRSMAKVMGVKRNRIGDSTGMVSLS